MSKEEPNQDNILPCPFCGGEAEESSEYESDENRPDGYLYFVCCKICESRGEPHYAISIWEGNLTRTERQKQNKGIQSAKQSAIESWNKRKNN